MYFVILSISLPKEKDARNIKEMVPGTKKNKQPIFKPGEEIKRNLGFVDKILSKRPASVLAVSKSSSE